MTKLTKKQQLEFEEKERKEDYLKLLEEYPNRLMTTLRSCTLYGFEIFVKEDLKFQIKQQTFDDGDCYSRYFYLAIIPSTIFDWNEIDDLEIVLKRLEIEKETKLKQEQLRKQALEKLTDEEKQALRFKL